MSLNNELNSALGIFKKARVKLDKVVKHCEEVKDAAMSRMEQAREDIELSGSVRDQARSSIRKIDEIMGVKGN